MPIEDPDEGLRCWNVDDISDAKISTETRRKLGSETGTDLRRVLRMHLQLLLAVRLAVLHARVLRAVAAARGHLLLLHLRILLGPMETNQPKRSSASNDSLSIDHLVHRSPFIVWNTT